jgi:hypothetical protein
MPGQNAYRIKYDYGEKEIFHAIELQQVVKKDDLYEVVEVLPYK